jgi:hypothetical protein
VVGSALAGLSPLTIAVLAIVQPSLLTTDFARTTLGFGATLLVFVPILFLFMHVTETFVNWADEWIRRKTEVRDDQTP